MEKGIENFFDYFKATFRIDHANPESYSPLSLAYIGDSVFDLMVRTMIVSDGNKQTQKYHEQVSSIVCARAQAKMMKGIKDSLTEEEHAIYKRGRNANTNTKAKNATLSEYRNATAFEAVLGYLYLNDDFIRLFDIVKLALDVLNNQDEDASDDNGVNTDISADDKEITDVPEEEMETADVEKDNSEWEDDAEDSVSKDIASFTVIDGGSNNSDYEEDGSGD